MPRAAVTGATGLVGSYLVRRLLADGWTVRALVRSASQAEAMRRQSIDVTVGHVLDADSLGTLVRGCDAVFHAAAVVTDPVSWDVYRRTNIEGTANIVAACTTGGARLVHVSSVAVYGGGSRYRADGTRTDETTPLAPLSDHAHYARSKRDSEALVLGAHARGAIWATAIRPDVIYGAGDRQFVPRVARVFSTGFAPSFNGGRAVLAIVHAANVADAAVRAAAHSGAGGQAYNVANDFDVTFADFARFASIGLGKRVRLVPIPLSVARLGLSAIAAGARLLTGDRRGAAVQIDFLARDNPFTSAKARAELGWNPPVHPRDGIPEAFRDWAVHS